VTPLLLAAARATFPRADLPFATFVADGAGEALAARHAPRARAPGWLAYQRAAEAPGFEGCRAAGAALRGGGAAALDARRGPSLGRSGPRALDLCELAARMHLAAAAAARGGLPDALSRTLAQRTRAFMAPGGGGAGDPRAPASQLAARAASELRRAAAAAAAPRPAEPAPAPARPPRPQRPTPAPSAAAGSCAAGKGAVHAARPKPAAPAPSRQRGARVAGLTTPPPPLAALVAQPRPPGAAPQRYVSLLKLARVERCAGSALDPSAWARLDKAKRAARRPPPPPPPPPQQPQQRRQRGAQFTVVP
jgi:hypothetical protein